MQNLLLKHNTIIKINILKRIKIQKNLNNFIYLFIYSKNESMIKCIKDLEKKEIPGLLMVKYLKRRLNNLFETQRNIYLYNFNSNIRLHNMKLLFAYDN